MAEPEEMIVIAAAVKPRSRNSRTLVAPWRLESGAPSAPTSSETCP